MILQNKFGVFHDMLDSLGYRKLISKAILAHTIAGLFAGIIAHWGWVLIEMII